LLITCYIFSRELVYVFSNKFTNINDRRYGGCWKI